VLTSTQSQRRALCLTNGAALSGACAGAGASAAGRCEERNYDVPLFRECESPARVLRPLLTPFGILGRRMLRCSRHPVGSLAGLDVATTAFAAADIAAHFDGGEGLQGGLNRGWNHLSMESRTEAMTAEARLAELVIWAHKTAYDQLRSHRDLADRLKRWLGRPLVARLTNTADANTISRWVRGSADPEATKVAKMRLAAETFFVLEKLFESEESARDWFTGQNPFLDYEMPVDAIKRGDSKRVAEAVRAVATL
jgi:hypothetical protein